MISSKLLTTIFGITFIASGLLGFVPNPLVAPDGVFAVNLAHNLVHFFTGVAFLAGGFYGLGRLTLFGIGVAYVLVTILGFLTSSDMLLGFIHINTADRWLHLGLMLAILLGGFISSDPEASSGGARPVAN